MQRYSEFRPTRSDTRGLGLPDRQDWLVAPVIQTRDSGCLGRSNFRSTLRALGGESETVEVHRFGHWGPGWFELILVAPDSAAAREAEEIESALSDYPIVDDSDYSELEQEEAQEVWANCYNTRQRLAYVRAHRREFEFHNFADMLGCIRGRYFAGYASELIG